jgi:hypothetical protein
MALCVIKYRYNITFTCEVTGSRLEDCGSSPDKRICYYFRQHIHSDGFTNLHLQCISKPSIYELIRQERDAERSHLARGEVKNVWDFTSMPLLDKRRDNHVGHTVNSSRGLAQRWCSRLVFGRCTVWVSVGAPSVLIKVLRGFPECLQANSGMLSRRGNDHFLPNPFQFISHHTIWRCIL